MKLNSTAIFSVTALVLSLAGVAAQAQNTITGSGVADSRTPPECSLGDQQKAQINADQDAAAKCLGQITRISDYKTTCEVLVHGYAARSSAVAKYDCE